VRAIFERKIPQINVVSFREIEPHVPLHVVEALGLPGPASSFLQQGAVTA
jgi:type III secretory pathway component EscV